MCGQARLKVSEGEDGPRLYRNLKDWVTADELDVACAAWLLKMRAHSKKYGDTGPTIIRVSGGFPDELR